MTGRMISTMPINKGMTVRIVITISRDVTGRDEGEIEVWVAAGVTVWASRVWKGGK
jgi:hypothetical protein